MAGALGAGFQGLLLQGWEGCRSCFSFHSFLLRLKGPSALRPPRLTLGQQRTGRGTGVPRWGCSEGLAGILGRPGLEPRSAGLRVRAVQAPALGLEPLSSVGREAPPGHGQGPLG